MFKEVMDKQIANAMKSSNHIELTVWRAIKNEFVKFETSGSGEVLTSEKELQIINKMVQQRKESRDIYLKAGRESLAKAEDDEISILRSLLPLEPNEDDINNVIKEFLLDRKIVPSMKDMRDIMNCVKSKYPTVDGSIVSKIFREKYINN